MPRLKAWIPYSRPIAIILIACLTTLVMATPVLAYSSDDEPRLRNVDWTMEGNQIIITYDLIATPNELYDISVVLLNENNPSFRIDLKAVSGHVGRGMFVGVERSIYWDYKKEFPQGLLGDGYYFEISVAAVSSGGMSWIYYAIGGAAVGTALILLKGGAGETTTQKSVLPTPPPRP